MKIKLSYMRIVLGVILPLGILLVASAFAFTPRHALSQSGSTLTGWIWSDTIGWISASCTDLGSCTTSNYSLTVASDGTISGYGWSENIGWVSANASDLAGCPTAPCTAKITDDSLTGWLKALSGGSSQSGGWDGWISLEGANYGPTLQDTGYFTGFAWGHDVTGWLNTALLRTGYEPCAVSYTCNGDTIVYQSPQCNTSNLATCDAPSFCSAGSSICLLPPITFIQSGSNTGHLQVRPQLVRKGGTTKVFWNVGNVTECTVTSSTDSWTGETSGPSGQTSNPIYQQTIFTLSCTRLDGSPMNPETATANIVPVFQEI
jgi:hypothetical protein